MGIPDSSLSDLIVKVRSWLYWGDSATVIDLQRFSGGNFKMLGENNNNVTTTTFCSDCCSGDGLGFRCRSCGRGYCKRCVLVAGDSLAGTCRVCSEMGLRRDKSSDKVHPSSSSEPCFGGRRIKCPADTEPIRPDHHFSRDCGNSPHSSGRSEDYGKHFFSPYNSDTDSISYSARNDRSSPSDSPSRINNTNCRLKRQELVLKKLDHDPSKAPLDFENNARLWYPPPPEDENDEAESNGMFRYEDEDDEDYTAAFFSDGNKEPLRAVVQGHFRALVSQLLQGEGLTNGQEVNHWLDIVTHLAWQAAVSVKPDTSRGGSMDPGDYVKVKCIASGSPSQSYLVKGVVCTKNIKHKRMTSQYKNPRLMILGGALEYQRVPNQLASFNTLLQQENDHLKVIISRIEAHRPNVLLVEKSVSSYAQECLLSMEISLVLNFKRPLLERISRCTGSLVTPSVDSISTTRSGHCELFRLEKFSEEHEPSNQFNRKPCKTLMFFEGCPRRLGCTVLLKGACREELKKVKHVVQYAVFAAYHLSLETSFLADEGASLPKMVQGQTISALDSPPADSAVTEGDSHDHEIVSLDQELLGFESFSGDFSLGNDLPLPAEFENSMVGYIHPYASNDGNASNMGLGLSLNESDERKDLDERQAEDSYELAKSERLSESEVSNEYSAADSHQSLLVSFSSHCVLKGTVCERSRLMRIRFYGCFDKPLGRYLRDDLFDPTMCCRSCKEAAEAHVLCYTHPQGNLTINVRRLPSLKLPGERDGRIWMWHRCLRCAHIEGVPPATRRVVMSDAAWGLSFGKFLELSFSNHATANRIATCGHSLQKDCLRYYGFGSTVAFFRYSPIDIMSIHLPPPVLEFNGRVHPEWLNKEVTQLMGKMETLYAEISDVLDGMESKSQASSHEWSDTCELENHITDLKELMKKERNDYIATLQPAILETSELDHMFVDVLELNRLRRALLVGSHVWDRRFYSLDSLLKRNSTHIPEAQVKSSLQLKSDSFKEDRSELFKLPDSPESEAFSKQGESNEPVSESCGPEEETNSDESTLSERIDSAWSGTDQVPASPEQLTGQADSLTFRRLAKPMRVHSFDSALRIQERIQKGLQPSFLHASSLRSFHASGEFRSMIRDPVSSVVRTYSQVLPLEAQKLNLILSSTPSFISSASNMSEGVRMLLPQTGHTDLVIAVYDHEPTSVISYTLSSKEYDDWIAEKSNEPEEIVTREDGSTLTAWQSFGSMDLDYMRFGTGQEDGSSTMRSLFTDTKKSPHLRLSFGDDTVKFSVTCYFAESFNSLRKKCCPSEVEFVRSLSRCKRWSAQGGKSNVYFAKSLDERFIVKQVTKTELESFEEFAPEYFKYLTESITSRSPTCLAKILGIYQVSTKHAKGGKDTKMDLMIMENLFFKRNISRVYDLKGSARSRYNSDTTGANSVLLDMNLLETLRTKPIFLGSKSKRSLERAIWNDTAFLASVDVMDYSLLVGVDEEREELVLGIIDYMRQYTWDKHLETWVKASGILGGPNNAPPTIISPIQYKKRFRKAMTTYFLTVPDQWSS